MTVQGRSSTCLGFYLVVVCAVHGAIELSANDWAGVLGTDRHGIPLVCGTAESQDAIAARIESESGEPGPGTESAALLILPANTRMWETVPGVVRDDGLDTFRLEVNVNGSVSNVVLALALSILSESGQATIALRDDGLQGDRVASDFIFTSEWLRFNSGWPTPPYYAYDTNSPAGLDTADVGTLTITETNGLKTAFLRGPTVGLLSSAIPMVETIALSTNVVISPHLVSLRGTNLSAQRFLRGFSLGGSDLTKLMYGAFPDAFDFVIYFSTYRLERLPYNAGANLNVGVQWPVQVNFTGTGQTPFNNTATYGSAGRLLGIVALDTYDRGVLSENCTHEILHEWASFVGAFPISDGQHYNGRSSVASLLGGHLWLTNGDGSWTLLCEEGRNGATHLDPLDKYFMGLIPASSVPILRTYPSSDPQPLFMCNGIITNVANSVTAANIAATYGVRSPGPATAQRDFSLGFVAESCQRLLNPVEITYYDILAGHYTKAVPPEHADPYVGFNWAPIARFFGEATTWRSDVLNLIRPKIISIEKLSGGAFRIVGSGYPGRPYVLQSSTNFSNWLIAGNQSAGTNGALVFLDNNAPPLTLKYYRLRGQ